MRYPANKQWHCTGASKVTPAPWLSFYKNKKSDQAIIYAKGLCISDTQSVDDRLNTTVLFSQNENTGSNGYASQFITLNDSIKKVKQCQNQFKIKYDSRKQMLKTCK
jgi:hypothetical protein